MSETNVQAMVHPPWLQNSWSDSLEVRNRGYQWLHKMVTSHRKKIEEELATITSLIAKN